MLEGLKNTVAKMPFGGTMAVVVGLVDGVIEEVAESLPGRKKAQAQPGPTDVTTDTP